MQACNTLESIAFRLCLISLEAAVAVTAAAAVADAAVGTEGGKNSSIKMFVGQKMVALVLPAATHMT